MSFKGEIALGALNTKYKYGFIIGDIYRVQGAGNLVPNNLAVANGAFVEWKSTGWEVKKDMQYAVSKTGESLDQAVADVLDDHDTDELMIFDVSKEFYDEHELGYYYVMGNKIYLCTKHTREGEAGAYTYRTELTKQNGVVPVLNELVNTVGDVETLLAAL